MTPWPGRHMLELDTSYSWDIGSWKVVGRGFTVTCLRTNHGQACWPRRRCGGEHADWLNLAGYLFDPAGGERKHACAAIGFRGDIANSHYIEAVHAEEADPHQEHGEE